MTRKIKIEPGLYESGNNPGEFVTVHRSDVYPAGTFVPFSSGVFASDEPSAQMNIDGFCRAYVSVFEAA